MECKLCKIKFKSRNDLKFHKISDNHIKRLLEPEVWNKADEIDNKIKQLDLDEDLTSKQKNKQISILMDEKKNILTNEKILDFDDYLKRSSNISKSITS